MSLSNLPNLPGTDAARAAPEPRRLSRRKKLAFGLVAVVLFFGLAELLLALVGVRPRSATDDPYVGFSSYAPLFVEAAASGGERRMVTAPGKLTWFNEQSFLREKPVGTYRIFCLGGSTTYGRPYDDTTSFAGWLRELLPAADRSRRWEVINAGGVSYASYRVARLMEELVEYEPDLFVILSGHNEFLERRTYGTIIETPEAIRGLGALVSRTRTGTLLYRLFGGGQARAGDVSGSELPTEVQAVLDSAIGPEVYTRDDEFARQVLAHYRFNLARMADLAHAAGAEVVLITPASNLKDASPFKSQHRTGMSAAERAEFKRHFRRAEQTFAAGKPGDALPAVERALALDRRHAHALYLWGRILYDLERYAEAKSAFVGARDEDVCPLRALSPVQDIVVRVAAERKLPVVDAVALVANRSPRGIPGSNLFLDHVHPTIAGNRLLALAIIDVLIAQGVVRPEAGWGETVIARVAAQVEDRLDRAAHGRALRNLSKVLGWAGKTEEAGRLALQAVELNPDDAEAQYQAGNALYAQGDLAGALERYRRSLALDPDSPQTHYGLGLVHTARGSLDEAIGCYREALRRDPTFIDARYNLAQLLGERDEFDLAERHFRAVLKVEPHHFEAANALGAVLARQHRYGEAGAWFQRALKHEPDFAPARENLEQLRALEHR